MKGRLTVVAMLVAASPLAAQDDYLYGRIRYAEPGVTVQGGSESVADEAEANLPFLPGDRVWTDAGRVEFQFADGSLVRLDARGKLEYMSAEDGAPDVLRLHSGSLFLHVRADDPGFEVETPAGLVTTVERGAYRVDAEADEVRLTVYEGEATLAAGRRRVSVREGERSYARRGDEPDVPRGFDPRAADDFARWDAEREGRGAWASERREYVPEEVAPYAGELDSHGSWYFQAEAGYVWRPYVAADWRPYCNGRWVWTAYGWTWVPQEPWGWAPSHYGRWDHSANLGWYWIPGRSWGPAWVHWAVGTNYVGWCPRGYRDRIVTYAPRAASGHAVPRGRSSAWVYARRDQVGAGLRGRGPVAEAAALADVHRIDSPHARPARDLRSVELGAARPSFRTSRLRPTPGDTIPELRSDNRTTIPAPVVRRRSGEASRDSRGRPAVTWGTSRSQARPRSGDADFSGVDAELRSQSRRTQRDSPRASPGSVEPRSRDDARSLWRERESERPVDTDRDVLRRMFKPLTDSSGERDGSGSSSWRGSRPEPRASGGARERSGESRPRPAEARPQGGNSRPRGESRPASKPQPREKGKTERHSSGERHNH